MYVCKEIAIRIFHQSNQIIAIEQNDKQTIHIIHDNNINLTIYIYSYIIIIRYKFKSTLSNCIVGATGEKSFANQWKNLYSSLLNSSSNTTDEDDVCQS